jgi:hypothetical protein
VYGFGTTVCPGSRVRIMLKRLEKVATLPNIRLGMRLYLQTVVRKSELHDGRGVRSISTMPSGRFRRSG